MITRIQSNGKYVSTFLLKVMLIVFILVNASSAGYAQIWTLQQCIDTAQVYNKNLQISRNNIALGSAKEQEAKAYLIPKINMGFDYKYYLDLPYNLMPLTSFNPAAAKGEFREIQFGVPHNINANIQLAMPLYNPQIYGAIKTTNIAAEISELQYKKAVEQVDYEISNLYYNAQILRHQQNFIDSNLVNTTRLLENLQLLYSQLLIKKTDVNKVELQKEQLVTQQNMVANNFEQIMNALKFTMGIPFTQNIQIDLKIENQDIQNYSMSETVDLQLANAQKRLISSELSTLKHSKLPSVSLLGNYSQVGFGYDKKPNDFLKFFPVSFAGLQVSIPLFNGTVTNRKIKQKKLEIQNSELQVALVTDQNNMLIDNAVRRRLVAAQTIENTSGQINLAATVYEQMLLQQREGTASLTEVLIADNALREAQQAYLLAIVDYLKSVLELKKLTGNISIKN